MFDSSTANRNREHYQMTASICIWGEHPMKCLNLLNPTPMNSLRFGNNLKGLIELETVTILARMPGIFGMPGTRTTSN